MENEFKEENVQFNVRFTLDGTLTIPTYSNKKYPAVLIIPGSGKSNRNGNGSKINLNLYKDLAEIITKLGFVTLRYDKRGIHKSKGVYVKTGFWDLVDDAESAVRFLKTRPEVDSEKIIILGHSEGCMIAPAVNSRLPISGLILLSGVAESAKIAFPRQMQQALKEIDEMSGFKGKFLRLMVKIQKSELRYTNFISKVLESKTPSIKIYGIVPFNAKWLQEHFAYDVMDELPNVTCPTIAITGSKDIQVLPEHAKILADNVTVESEWYIIPDMNHILRKYENEHTMLNLIKEYKKIKNNPLDPNLITILSAWLNKNYIKGRDDVNECE